MARRMMLKDMRTGRWGWYTVSYAKSPWAWAWTAARWLARHIRRHTRVLPVFPKTYEFDPDTLNMRDPERERRMRRRDRRDRMLAKAAHALTAMVEMQKFIG